MYYFFFSLSLSLTQYYSINSFLDVCLFPNSSIVCQVELYFLARNTFFPSLFLTLQKYWIQRFEVIFEQFIHRQLLLSFSLPFLAYFKQLKREREREKENCGEKWWMRTTIDQMLYLMMSTLFWLDLKFIYVLLYFIYFVPFTHWRMDGEVMERERLFLPLFTLELKCVCFFSFSLFLFSYSYSS